jgi:hypothetical protein
VIDSNNFVNQSLWGMRLVDNNFISLSGNRVTNTETTQTWYGIYIYNSNGPITNNRIIQHLGKNPNSYGIYANNSTYNGTDTCWIVNNEIILHTDSISHGIYGGSRVKVLHNSIRILGTGAARGITASFSPATTIKNNNIAMESPMAYPIYVASTTNAGLAPIDANNYYASVYVGYAGGDIVSLSVWKALVTSDINSVQINPTFINDTIDLRLIAYTGFECATLPEVVSDINGFPRLYQTGMGCYNGIDLSVNAVLYPVNNWNIGMFDGESDTLKVRLMNVAHTPLTTVALRWSFNGGLAQQALWTGSLTTSQQVIVPLGVINYVQGTNTLDVWIENLGGLIDEYLFDDTIHTSCYACDSALTGTYTIGASGDFNTIEQAFERMHLCRTKGDLTLALQPGNYTYNLNLSNNAAYMNNYTLTFTSTTGKASDVILRSTAGMVVQCNNTNNIVLDAITIDATAVNYGIQFTGASSNITIKNAIILANPTSLTNTAGIYKATNTAGLDGLTVKNCTIDGGVYGIYLLSTSNFVYSNLSIDSNILSNQYSHGLYFGYTHNQSVSWNHITPRNTGGGTTWYGMYMDYPRDGGKIIGNRIFSDSIISITTNLYGCYFNYIENALIANNEIYLHSKSSTTYGIYISYPQSVECLHNTVLLTGTGGYTFRALHMQIIASIAYSATVSNNIFIANGGISPYAIYLYSNVSAYQTYYKFAYNNYYSSGNLGYAGGNQSTLAAWKGTMVMDIYSVNILPVFTDPSSSLELKNYMNNSIICPSLQAVPTDIREVYHSRITNMGAYIQPSGDLDLTVNAVFPLEVINNQIVPLSIEVKNTGIVTVTNANIGWSVNGITQAASIPWTATPSLGTQEQQNISIGSFTAANMSAFTIKVWINTVNGGKDSALWNDTLTTIIPAVPLARFVNPLVEDTIYTLSFNVYAEILKGTGSEIAVPVPKLYIETSGNGRQFYDTLNMQYSNNVWEANIPPQYYGSTVTYTLTVHDTLGNMTTISGSTCIRYADGSDKYLGANLGIISTTIFEDPFNLCSPDYLNLTYAIINSGITSYDFNTNPVNLHLQVTTPDSLEMDVLLATGILSSGDIMNVRLNNGFPVIAAGRYDIKAWMDNIADANADDDTVLSYYTSGKLSLPIDENFSDAILTEFIVRDNNTSLQWTVIPQGLGIDTAVHPVFGNGVLSFLGSRGAMTTLATKQMDLSRTIQPSLSFWYFHDTIPSEDYTDVRITIDGGATYNTLYSLTKYDPVYGWKQDSADLPAYAVNQCVTLIFEAMEKSNGNVTQYIDRILITARQDIAIAEIFTSPLSVCDLENKEIKVVMSNLSFPVLDYTTTPTTLTLEVTETGQTFIFDTLLTNSSLGSFASDTIIVATGFNFAVGTYTLKAYFSSVLDVDRNNDTLETSIVINPALSVQVEQISGGNVNCLLEDNVIYPKVTLYNTGNIDLSDIDLTIQIDTGENNLAVYALFREIYTGTILAGDSAIYIFTSSYTVPWNARYDVRVNASLNCDSALAHNTNMIQECVDTKDLHVVSIDNPTGNKDNIGSNIQVRTTIENRSDGDIFNSVQVNFVVTNSQGVQTASGRETLPAIGSSATVSHTFNSTYTVPADSVYYLAVFLDSYENYPANDTIRIKRETNVGIETLAGNGFTLGQNIPNPVKNTTHIDYSIPESGEVIFYVQSASGQLLYSKTIEATSGKNSLELNTSTLAAGIYVYSIEYKGQRLIKRMSVQK